MYANPKKSRVTKLFKHFASDTPSVFVLLGKTVNYNNQLSISKYKLPLAASSKMFFLMSSLFSYALKSRGIK